MTQNKVSNFSTCVGSFVLMTDADGRIAVTLERAFTSHRDIWVIRERGSEVLTDSLTWEADTTKTENHLLTTRFTFQQAEQLWIKYLNQASLDEQTSEVLSKAAFIVDPRG